MEYQHRQKQHWTLAPHQIATLRDAVNAHRASTNEPSESLIFLTRLLNVEDLCNIAVSIAHLENGVGVVNDDTKLWVRRARNTPAEQE